MPVGLLREAGRPWGLRMNLREQNTTHLYCAPDGTVCSWGPIWLLGKGGRAMGQMIEIRGQITADLRGHGLCPWYTQQAGMADRGLIWIFGGFKMPPPLER